MHFAIHSVAIYCEVTLDGEGFTNWSASGPGEITIRTTVDDHHPLVRCRRTGKPLTKTSDLSEGTAWMENDELMAGIAGTGNVRQIRRQVLRFVLS